jgi:hypothetical protein
LKIFSKTHRAKKKVQIYWQGDLMTMKKSNIAYMFIGEILANVTQVSDVAPGLYGPISKNRRAYVVFGLYVHLSVSKNFNIGHFS